MSRIGRAHHVLRVEHLLRELRHRQRAVLLGAAGRERREAVHKEMQTRERHHVRAKLAEIAVELAREADGARYARETGRHQVVKIAVGRSGELQGPEANVVKGFVIQGEAEVRVLHELVHRKRAVVRLNHRVRNLWARHDRVSRHDAVRILLTNLRDEERAHPGASTTAERMRHLESLEAIASLSLLTDNVQHRVDELCALRVMALGPVVASTGLAEDEIVRTEELTERAGTHRVHGTRLQIHEDRTRHVAAAGGLVVVHIDALELQVRVTVVSPGGVDTVLITDHLPELRTDLVAALAALDVHELTHGAERNKQL